MSIKKTKEQFIKEARAIHANKYNYDLVKYNGAHKYVIIICPIIGHGKFLQTPNDHIGKNKEAGCPKCGILSRSKQRANGLDGFKKIANTVHNSQYNYSKVVYVNNKTKIIINCRIHGGFLQTPHDHTSGAGCPECAPLLRPQNQPDTLDAFIKKSIVKHGNKYIYSSVVYIDNKTKVNIICPKKDHGTFAQTPTNHTQGIGCPICSHLISKSEILWLNYLNIPNNKQCRQVNIQINGGTKKVDGFNSTINTIYEFYGDYWHGNPKIFKSKEINKSAKITFGKLYQNTKEREKLLQRAGYNLISIWESDFKKINHNAQLLMKQLKITKTSTLIKKLNQLSAVLQLLSN